MNLSFPLFWTLPYMPKSTTSVNYSSRPGVNLQSRFNVSNKTTFDDETDRDADTAEEKPLDFGFYRKFWLLQKFFNNPDLCYDHVQFQEFQEVCSCAEWRVSE